MKEEMPPWLQGYWSLQMLRLRRRRWYRTPLEPSTVTSCISRLSHSRLSGVSLRNLGYNILTLLIERRTGSAAKSTGLLYDERYRLMISVSCPARMDRWFRKRSKHKSMISWSFKENLRTSGEKITRRNSDWGTSQDHRILCGYSRGQRNPAVPIRSLGRDAFRLS